MTRLDTAEIPVTLPISTLSKGGCLVHRNVLHLNHSLPPLLSTDTLLSKDAPLHQTPGKTLSLLPLHLSDSTARSPIIDEAGYPAARTTTILLLHTSSRTGIVWFMYMGRYCCGCLPVDFSDFSGVKKIYRKMSWQISPPNRGTVQLMTEDIFLYNSSVGYFFTFSFFFFRKSLSEEIEESPMEESGRKRP